MTSELTKALIVNQRLQITAWDPLDERNESTYNSFIMDVEPPFIKVALPTKKPEELLPWLKQGLVLGVVIETYPNPYIFYPLIHSLQETPPEGLWLKIPDNPKLEVIQRRNHVRIPMVLPIIVEFSLGGKLIPLSARTEDMSGGGLRFTSARLFQNGQELLVTIQLNPEDGKLELRCNVVFSNENRVKRQPDDIYVTACQFQDLDSKEEAIIMRECFRRELKNTF